jgi:hypothetical protein
LQPQHKQQQQQWMPYLGPLQMTASSGLGSMNPAAGMPQCKHVSDSSEGGKILTLACASRIHAARAMLTDFSFTSAANLPLLTPCPNCNFCLK